MGFFEFVIVLVIIGTVSSVITGGIRLQKHQMKLKLMGAGEETEALRMLIADMSGEIKSLKERMRVLERLATDSDRNLASEIERLRRDEFSPGV